MTPTERQAFLEERSTGIGGSDIASLLQPLLTDDVKYGCRRRLWYDKSGIPEDYPQDDSGPMRLGRILEPHIADWHMEATGDVLTVPDTNRHPAHPELLVHIDRIISDADHGDPGAAEIKALGPDMYWQTKRDGIVVDYILQLQHGMLCGGETVETGGSGEYRPLTWGKFIVGNRAYGGKPLAWTQNADQDVHEAILAEGPAFWATLRNPDKMPERLEPDDKRCGTCCWRKTCHGDSLIHSDSKQDLPYAEDIRGLLLQYDEVMAKFTEKLSDGSRGTPDDLRAQEIKDEIKTMMATRDAVAVSWGAKKDRKVYFRQQDGRTSWKMEGLTAAYESMRSALIMQERAALDGLDVDSLAAGGLEVANKFPAVETFKQAGVPFKVLRIY